MIVIISKSKGILDYKYEPDGNNSVYPTLFRIRVYNHGYNMYRRNLYVIIEYFVFFCRRKLVVSDTQTIKLHVGIYLYIYESSDLSFNNIEYR